MNTKFSFALLLLVVIAVIAAACAPVIVDSSAPLDQAVQPASNESAAILPMTGGSAATTGREMQATQRWSGEIFLADGNSPDDLQNPMPAANENPLNGCMAYDSQPRRQSGCVE